MPAVLGGTRDLEEEKTKFKSGLKWISVKSLKRGAFDPASLFPDLKNPNMMMGLPNVFGAIFLDSTLVHPSVSGKSGRLQEYRMGICSAKVQGRIYPGEAWYGWRLNDGGQPWCYIITKTGVWRVRDFRLLFNPSNAANIDWELWEGKGYTNFPSSVFKSDEKNNLMVGRYIGATHKL